MLFLDELTLYRRDLLEKQRDDEVEPWLRHGYMSEVKRARKKK